jgi:hypothetical protein
MSYRAVIRDYDCIPSVSDGRKVPFVSIDDVIAPACEALLDTQSHNKEEIIVGPELLSYDEASCIPHCLSVTFNSDSCDGIFRLQRYSPAPLVVQ